MNADPKAALKDRARVVGWGVAIVAAVQAAGAYLAQNATGAVIAQLVIAEFGTGRLGVAWSDPLAPIPTGADIARRVGRGALFGASASVILIGAAVAARAAEMSVGPPGIAPLLVGVIVAACTAAREELLLRGLVLRALGPNASFAVRLAVCGLAGAAYRFGTDPGATVPAIGFACLSSVAFAGVWVRDRGAWLATGAHAAWAFVTGPVAHGALLDLRVTRDARDAWIALACAVFFAGSAISYARRNPSSIEAA